MRSDALHLEADFALLAAEAGQHEEDEGEETREGDGHHSQGGRPGQLTQWSAICRSQRGKNVSSGTGFCSVIRCLFSMHDI